MNSVIHKVLVANRGEIALRILKSLTGMGLATVAVYSEADRDAPHVLAADEAVFLGPAPAKDSYLRGEKLIEAARQAGADAIHPGYGFLSENAAFARAVEEAGLIFIGPPATAIATMGSKLAAKQAVKAFGIPMVPGTAEALSDPEAAAAIAEGIGYPVLIKASAGGGGKGMRIVERPEEFRSQMARAISEATAAFGDGAVFVEKYISSPHHVEIQVLADQQGQVRYLFERECSIQRRHQKVIEEAPSPLLTPEVRQAMGEAAVKVAQACAYVGAGTVEFLVDESLNFYFLEMNTRLQVEHPVTEEIVRANGKRLDLVAEQVRIARGEAISFKQADLSIEGHAIELRVYAEDPGDQFLPSVGTLHTYRPPSGVHIRVDDGYRAGMEVPMYYDPLLAKLVVWGESREAAIRRMREAIRHYQVEGVATTLPFGEFVMTHEAFVSGSYNTHFVGQHFRAEAWQARKQAAASLAAQAALKIWLERRQQLQAPESRSPHWRINRKYS